MYGGKRLCNTPDYKMWSSTFKTKIGTTASMYVCLSASCLNKVLASTQHCLADDWQVTWLFTKLEFTAVTCLCARTVAEALFHVSEHRTGKAAESGHLWCCQNKKREKLFIWHDITPRKPGFKVDLERLLIWLLLQMSQPAVRHFLYFSSEAKGPQP